MVGVPEEQQKEKAAVGTGAERRETWRWEPMNVLFLPLLPPRWNRMPYHQLGEDGGRFEESGLSCETVVRGRGERMDLGM